MDEKDKHSEPIGKIILEDAEKALAAAFLACRTEKEVKAFLTDLCTPQEIGNLAERWLVARLLNEGGLSYRDVHALTGISTTTIGRVARFLQQEPHHGYRHFLDNIARK